MFKKLKFQNAKLVSAVKNFMENPIDNLGIIIPYLAVITAIGGFIVAFILFIVRGGYENQINVLSSDGIYLIGKVFTYGTVSIMFGNIVGKILAVLLGAELLLMIIELYKESSKAKRIIISIDLGLGALISTVALIFVSIIDRKIIITPEQQANLFRFLNEQNYETILLGLAIVGAASIIAFLILVLTSKSIWMLGHALVSGVISLGAIPLLLLFVENIIPLIAGIVALAILGIVIRHLFSAMAGGDSEVTSSGKNLSKQVPDEPKRQSNTEKNNYKQEEPEKKYCIGNVKLYQNESYGWNGLGTFIFSENEFGIRECLCSVNNFKSGKVEIYVDGKRITNCPGKLKS